MQRESYERVREAFDTLGEIQDPALRTIDTENVIEARKQLAWSLRRWGTEFEEGIPAEAAGLAPDGEPHGPHDDLREAADRVEAAREAVDAGGLGFDPERLSEEDVRDVEEALVDLKHVLRKLSMIIETKLAATEEGADDA